MEHEGRFVRCRRAFEEATQDGDDDVAVIEIGQDVAQLGCAFGRVELVAALHQSGSDIDVQVGPEGDNQDVGVVGAFIGYDAFAVGVDGGDGLLAELDVGPGDVPVVQSYVAEAAAPEHHVQLREAEDKRVTLVDESDLDLVAKVLGQPGRELQAAEPGSEDQNSGRHL